MEGHDRPSHSLIVLFSPISAGNHRNIPATDCQRIALLDSSTFLQYDFSSRSLIDVAVGGDGNRGNHHFTCDRACNSDLISRIVEQIGHVLAASVHALTNCDLTCERGSSTGDTSMLPDNSSMQKFPSFVGKDLDGNDVTSDELFSGSAVTVVNFWFTTCGPCVGELGELEALSKELAEKGGSLIGINSFTLDGDEAAISDAKDVLMKKGATYQNVYFASDSEAGMFTANIFAYPTTYVVDRSGNIVGDPIVGAVTSKAQMETLQKLIDQTLAADMG